MTQRRTNNQGFSLLKVAVPLLLAVVIVAGVVAWQTRDTATPDKQSSSQGSESSASAKEERAGPAAEKNGLFAGVAPKTGSGSVTLKQNAEGSYIVQLEDDFSVQNGPDLYVSFGNNGEVDHDTLFSTLDAFNGKQEYLVPDNIDASKYNQVIIYCKEFSVVFSVAPLS